MPTDALASQREDELAIRDLAYRYARLVDRRDYAEIPRVFTPDCEVTTMGFTMRGHAEIDSAFRKIEMYSATLHCVHNQMTRVDGDRAEGEFYCLANHIHERDGVAYKLDMGIRYEDRYVRTAQGWRIAQRVLNLIWQQDLPLDLSLAVLAGPGRAARAARGAKPAPKKATTRTRKTGKKVLAKAGGERGRKTTTRSGGRKASARKGARR